MENSNADFVRYFSATLNVELSFFAQNRTAFSDASDQSPSWTLIGATSGAWHFSVDAQSVESQNLDARSGHARSGICGAFEWVLCPPHTHFKRRVTLAPLSFHVLRFGWEVEPGDCPLIGWNAPRDRARLSSNFGLWRALGERGDATAVCAREHVLRDVLTAAWLEKLESAPLPRPPDAAMDAARRFLETRAAGAVSLAELAAQNRLSPVAFTRRFREAHGQAPSDFLIQCRLERARALLLDTHATLDAIAAQSGFGSGFYLSRMWSKKWGGTPSGFRRAHRI